MLLRALQYLCPGLCEWSCANCSVCAHVPLWLWIPLNQDRWRKRGLKCSYIFCKNRQMGRRKKPTICNLWVPPPQGKSHNYCEMKREFPQECSAVLTAWGKSFHRHLPFRLPVRDFSAPKSSWCSCKPACAGAALGAITVRWKTPVVIYPST